MGGHSRRQPGSTLFAETWERRTAYGFEGSVNVIDGVENGGVQYGEDACQEHCVGVGRQGGPYDR